uniref:Uncharacterized protein n=1 Tax=Opuntia streptacantha TaxID=393608 RepID=A0A7C8Z9P7_OPUST
MALASFSYPSPPSITCHDQSKSKAPLVGWSGSLDFPVVQSKAVISPLHCWRAISVKPVNAELLAVSLLDALEVEDNNLNGGVEHYEELAKAMENAPPLEIMDKALEKFGNDIAIAFRSNSH